jgi:acetolactate synthase-1/2/3 large subunit
VLGTVAQPPAVEILAESDCVIAFGAGLNRFTAQGSAFVGKTVVHVDTDPAVFDTFTAVDAQVLCDARITATIMIEQLRAADHRPSAFRSEDIGRRVADCDPRADYTDAGSTTQLDVRSAMLRLDELLPRDRIVVTHVGRFVGAPWRFVHVQNPLDFAHSAAFGSIGLGTAMAVGAAAAHPDRLTPTVAGDRGAMMGIAEFATAVRHRLPLMLVVVNDGGYGLTVHTLADLEPVSDHVADWQLPLLVDIRVDAALGIVASIGIVVYFLGAILAHIRITDLKGTAPAVSLLALRITSFVLAIARW